MKYFHVFASENKILRGLWFHISACDKEKLKCIMHGAEEAGIPDSKAGGIEFSQGIIKIETIYNRLLKRYPDK